VNSNLTFSKSDGIWLLFATIIPSSMTFIDSTALNVALPAIQRDLNLTGAELLWIVNGFTLFVSALLLVGGSIGDVVGRKKVFMLGIVLFVVSSVTCALATNGFWLIVFRSIQGIGAALLIPGSLSLITALFPKERRARAIGIWSMFSAITTIAGPILGGFLSENGLWRWIFLINVPLGAIALLILFKKVRETSSESTLMPHYLSPILAIISLALICYGLIQMSVESFSNVFLQVCIAAGIVLFVLFIWFQKVSNRPMLPLEMFKNKTFAATNVITFLIYGALSATLFFFPLVLIQAQGYTPIEAAISMIPLVILIGGLSVLSGKIVAKFGYRLPLIFGPLITGLGFLAFELPDLTSGIQSYWSTFFIPIVLTGIGMGITVVPLTTTVMSSGGEDRSGISSGINNTVSRLAGLIAIAVFGTLGISIFKALVLKDVVPFSLTQIQLNELSAQLINYGDAKVPLSLEYLKTEISQIIKLRLVSSFKIISVLSGSITLFTVLISMIFIKRRTVVAQTD
jgi:EmrB/QacA subfamily drug resistance transporter